MRGIIAWLSGWATTLRIMIFERETFRYLRDYEFDVGDFTEVGPPECNLCPTPCSGCEKWER